MATYQILSEPIKIPGNPDANPPLPETNKLEHFVIDKVTKDIKAGPFDRYEDAVEEMNEMEKAAEAEAAAVPEPSPAPQAAVPESRPASEPTDKTPRLRS